MMREFIWAQDLPGKLSEVYGLANSKWAIFANLAQTSVQYLATATISILNI
jgi:hypothetical protein